MSNTISKIWTVARYTFKEGVRANFFVAAALTCVAVVLIGSVIASVPYGRADHLIGRIGWGTVLLTGVAVNLFFVITMLARERDERVLHLLVSKPISRSQYALGKFFGYYALMALMVCGEGLVVAAMMNAFGEFPRDFLADWWQPALFVTLKCGTLVAFSCFAAFVFSTPLVAMAVTATYYLMAVSGADITTWGQLSENPIYEQLGQVMSWLAPQFTVYDFEGWQIYGVETTARALAAGGGYFLGYTAIALVFYVVAFEWLELG
ncbi:MAG: hypothetical protein D6761_01820 [Candidatus Dadabacteria bacterium]|nr:MAG: hypothetical protein D6761_01820 [Candidatus Dadabacteria bacterium]